MNLLLRIHLISLFYKLTLYWLSPTPFPIGTLSNRIMLIKPGSPWFHLLIAQMRHPAY